MKTSMAVGAAAFALAVAAVPAAQAQSVEAGVVIQSGPVRGHVVIADPAPVVVYREPPRHVVVVERYQPRRVIVERVYAPRGRAIGWWRKHGYGATTVYYDPADDCYYERRVGGRPGLREVVVYERDGRYYRSDVDDYDHDGRRDYREYRDRRDRDWDD
jgi:hypothetical protein